MVTENTLEVLDKELSGAFYCLRCGALFHNKFFADLHEEKCKEGGSVDGL